MTVVESVGERGTWEAQSVKHLTSTLVMISQFMDGFQPSVSL